MGFVWKCVKWGFGLLGLLVVVAAASGGGSGQKSSVRCETRMSNISNSVDTVCTRY